MIVEKDTTAAERMVSWLEQHRLINLVLVLAYFLFILFMHGPLVEVAVNMQNRLSFRVYDIVVAAVYISFLIAFVTFLRRYLVEYKENLMLKLFYLFATLAFIFIHSRFMFDSNMEAIHSLEFTFLAVLLFPFTRRFGAAIVFAIPFMLIDELYQYWVLYPDFNDYYDLNDIGMDTYGCGLAMATLLIFGVRGEEPVKPFWKRIEFWSLLGLVVAILVATMLCFIAPYEFEKCSNTILVINERLVPEPFWRQHPTNLNVFHTAKPAEGLLMFTLIALFYFGLDSFRKPVAAAN